MKSISMIVIIIGLVSCGADGEPLTPAASKGLSLGAGSVNTHASVDASNGNVSFGAGL